MKAILCKTIDSWAVFLIFPNGQREYYEHFPTHSAAYAWAYRTGVELIEED